LKNSFRLSRCRNIFFLLSLFQGVALSLYSQQSYWQQEVNYRIDVTLDDQQHSLDGFEEITYSNHSPDALHFIWFHIWPNAYKNDRTAFSEQLLLNGRTDFYFSNKAQRGYINRLDFKVNGITARLEDHPQHIDVIKLILPSPLAPGASISITTPFHVQLPENFSRGGHKGEAYQVTQWYPKPAVYDRKGWHPMPYLDQGEYYSDFGKYEVNITLPSNYVVAATGVLQDQGEKEWLLSKQFPEWKPEAATAGKKTAKRDGDSFPPSATSTKTVRYIQDKVHDFAWFADKRFVVMHDTLRLNAARVIDVYSYFLPGSETSSNSIEYLKNAVRTRSLWLGEYPYDVITAVETETGVAGGMEYPTITSISRIASEKENNLIIGHEVGHNWFQGILATNERRFPWMDEGMNSYYDNRYEALLYQPAKESKEAFGSKRIPGSLDKLLFQTIAAAKLDQPINTASESFSSVNYGLGSYHKAAAWMSLLEQRLGRVVFDSCMKHYYETWKFKHPYPEDFKQIIDSVSGTPTDDLFELLDKKGSLTPPAKKELRLTTYFNLKETDKYQYISLAPAVGYNMYDGFQIGGLVHNYQLPLSRLQFLAAPLYATKSKTLNGLFRGSYNWYAHGKIQNFEAGAAASTFSMDEFMPEAGERLTLKFRKLAPFIRLQFRQHALSNAKKQLQLKWFFIKEDGLNFAQQVTGSDTTDVITVSSAGYHLAELKYSIKNTRALYPYQSIFNLQYHKDFVRATVTGSYFYNYANNKGGINIRWFAGKFFYTRTGDEFKTFDTERFHLNLTGARGYEDYTYSNYFIGRNEFKGFASQQLMMRDGGFKVGTELLDRKIGKTDDWLGALNFTIHVPDLSDKLPIKLFFDIGTYAEAWEKEAEGSRFIYDAGLQLSLFRDIVNVYVPVLYSAVYKNYFRSTLGEQRFLKTISFSINIQDISLKKIRKDLVF
jgi:hypothetical protein